VDKVRRIEWLYNSKSLCSIRIWDNFSPGTIADLMVLLG
jgi:hypothetical protein